MPEQIKSGILFILSGPAGCGKTTLCNRMIAELPQIKRVVTSTTRAPRKGEVDKSDYYFFDQKTFEKKINAGEFYEYAQVHGNLYGTLKSEVQEKLDSGCDLLLNIDVQGASQIRKTAQDESSIKGRVVTIFLVPSSIEVLGVRHPSYGGQRDFLNGVCAAHSVGIDEDADAEQMSFMEGGQAASAGSAAA